MLSMTGFGHGAAAAEAGQATVQIASVNNRGWVAHLRAEGCDLALEEAVRTRLRTALVRGSITAAISWRPAGALALDLEQLARAWQGLAASARSLGAPAPTLEGVAQLLPMTRGSSPAPQPLVLAALEQAIAQLREQRAREGDCLARDLAGHARRLRALHAEMSARAAERLPQYRSQLLARLTEVLGEAHPLEPERIVRELALHAERIDISEELVRLRTHLEALEALVASREEALGRRLEFLLQECAREVSTTGAKANDAALTTLTLEAKYVIEQMKEQAANIA